MLHHWRSPFMPLRLKIIAARESGRSCVVSRESRSLMRRGEGVAEVVAEGDGAVVGVCGRGRGRGRARSDSLVAKRVVENGSVVVVVVLVVESGEIWHGRGGAGTGGAPKSEIRHAVGMGRTGEEPREALRWLLKRELRGQTRANRTSRPRAPSQASPALARLHRVVVALLGPAVF